MIKQDFTMLDTLERKNDMEYCKSLILETNQSNLALYFNEDLERCKQYHDL